jgi:hypothetical protein
MSHYWGIFWAVVTVVMILLGLAMIFDFLDSSREEEDGEMKLGIGFVLVGIAMSLAPFLYEFSGTVSSVVSVRRDGSYTKHEGGCWEWEPGKLFNVFESVECSRSIALMDDDPFGAMLNYEVKISVAEPGIFFDPSTDRWNESRSIDEVAVSEKKIAHFYLDQFEKEYTDELRSYANVVENSDDTKKPFEEFVLTWVNERLARYGLRATSAKLED